MSTRLVQSTMSPKWFRAFISAEREQREIEKYEAERKPWRKAIRQVAFDLDALLYYIATGCNSEWRCGVVSEDSIPDDDCFTDEGSLRRWLENADYLHELQERFLNTVA